MVLIVIWIFRSLLIAVPISELGPDWGWPSLAIGAAWLGAHVVAFFLPVVRAILAAVLWSFAGPWYLAAPIVLAVFFVLGVVDSHFTRKAMDRLGA